MKIRHLYCTLIMFFTFFSNGFGSEIRDRLDLINYLIEKNNFNTYLEIGVADGKHLQEVKAKFKTGVDPNPWESSRAIYYGHNNIEFFPMTSDDFFKRNVKKYDIVFIDGLHLWEQALTDVFNAMDCLNPGGVIIMHDCLPGIPEEQVRTPPPGASWTGDVWKAAAFIRMNIKNVNFCVIDFDCGCGVLIPNSTQECFTPRIPQDSLDWNVYLNNRNKLLNVVKIEDWIRKN